MIALGAIVANLIAYVIIKKKKLDINDFIAAEGYALLGGMIGAKLLFFLVDDTIDWSRILEKEYLSAVLGSGFVFYGGLIGGLLMLLIPWKVHKINVPLYFKYVVSCIPIAHAFGRVGCFLSGCCYGMEYHGPIAVVFPEGSFAPAGVERFPSQLVEAVLLFLIGLIDLLIIMRIQDAKYTVVFYLFTYSIVRFVLEFFRGDGIRKYWGSFTTSQWISMFIILALVIYIVVRAVKNPRGQKDLG